MHSLEQIITQAKHNYILGIHALLLFVEGPDTSTLLDTHGFLLIFKQGRNLG